ncbi:MAG: DUF503 domain-containing protein [Coxiellaceae bacterium]|nr:MAG: DUF503 domain-containing protein [Coxiellaceae bacterium]
MPLLKGLSMYVGIYKITLRLPSNQNLKGKRRIIQSLIQNLRGHFNAAVAEVEHHDLWQLATIGITTVSNDANYLQQLQSKLMAKIESMQGEFEITNVQQEILSGV